MLSTLGRVVLSLWLCLCAVQAAADAQPTVPTGVSQTLTTSHDGLARQYLVYTPRSLANVASRPAVLMLHGNNMDAAGMAYMVGMQAAAETYGFVAVLPQTPNRTPWENGRPRAQGSVPRNDAGFILKVVGEIASYQRVDPARVFIAGVSSGAMMSMRMNCEAAGTFLAVGAVSGLLPEGLVGCRPSRALPILVMHGTIDDVILFNGTPGAIRSYADTRAHWIAANGCQRTTGAVPQPDRYNDRTTVTLERPTQCARPGVELALYIIQGGGHVWPGQARTDGRDAQVNSQEVNATDALMAFFAQHGL